MQTRPNRRTHSSWKNQPVYRQVLIWRKNELLWMFFFAWFRSEKARILTPSSIKINNYVIQRLPNTKTHPSSSGIVRCWFEEKKTSNQHRRQCHRSCWILKNWVLKNFWMFFCVISILRPCKECQPSSDRRWNRRGRPQRHGAIRLRWTCLCEFQSRSIPKILR